MCESISKSFNCNTNHQIENYDENTSCNLYKQIYNEMKKKTFQKKLIGIKQVKKVLWRKMLGDLYRI